MHICNSDHNENTPTGASTNPKNFYLKKNFNLIGTCNNLDSKRDISKWNSKLKYGTENWNWKLKLKIRIKNQNKIEHWNQKLKAKKIEIENWNQKLKLKLKIKIENYNWRLKLKIENWYWKLKLKIEIGIFKWGSHFYMWLCPFIRSPIHPKISPF